jgi:molecular chaperone GrpE
MKKEKQHDEPDAGKGHASSASKKKEEHEDKKQDHDAEYKKLKTEFDELKSLLQRLGAEYENYRKRTEKNCAMQARNANIELIKDLIPVIDHFELALSKADENEMFAKGMILIHDQFMKVLGKYGVEEIDDKDKEFDPRVHEAVCMEEGDCEGNKVIEVMQKGYKLQDMIIRPAKVKISMKKQKKDGE